MSGKDSGGNGQSLKYIQMGKESLESLSQDNRTGIGKVNECPKWPSHMLDLTAENC